MSHWQLYTGGIVSDCLNGAFLFLLFAQTFQSDVQGKRREREREDLQGERRTDIRRFERIQQREERERERERNKIDTHIHKSHYRKNARSQLKQLTTTRTREVDLHISQSHFTLATHMTHEYIIHTSIQYVIEENERVTE